MEADVNELILKLADEEYRALGMRIRKEEGLGPRDYVDVPYEAIVDAATSKAAWGCVVWLLNQQDDDGFYTEWAIAESLKLFLEAQGIQKPTSE